MNTPVLDVKKAWVSRELKHDRQLFRAQFSPDGKYLAIGRYQWVQLWDIQTQKVIHNFEPHADAV